MIDFLKFINQSDEDKYNMLLEAQAEIHKLQQENQSLKEQQKEFIKFLEEKEKMFDIAGDPRCAGVCHGVLLRYKKIKGLSEVE